MRVCELSIDGFRALAPFPAQGSLEIGALHGFVGRNDSGKSSVLLALSAFFSEKMEEGDFTSLTQEDRDEFSITVSFSDLPSRVELEPGVETSLEEEQLTSDEKLVVRKTFNKKQGKVSVKTDLFVQSLEELDIEKGIKHLCLLKEDELIKLGDELGLSLPKSGAGNTNKERRRQLRQHLSNYSINLMDIPGDDILKRLKPHIPQFVLFHDDQSMDIKATSFQNQFKPIIAELLVNSPVDLEQARQHIDSGLTKTFDDIHKCLLRHTQEISRIDAITNVAWEKSVSFDLILEDNHSVKCPPKRRGAGIRRLLMVAYMQYLAEASDQSNTNYLFAIEEPELYLHPSAQRELLTALLSITENRNQVLLSTHSPVFAGAIRPDSLTLVSKQSGVSQARTLSDYSDEVDYANEIRAELGIAPSDNIAGARALVFVEGGGDISILRIIDQKYVDAGLFEESLEATGIRFIPGGGLSGIKTWIDMNLCWQLDLPFMVIFDSDRDGDQQPLSQSAQINLDICTSHHIDCHCWRLAEIESYLSPAKFTRLNQPAIAPARFRVNGVKPKSDLKTQLNQSGLLTEIAFHFSECSQAELASRATYTNDNGDEVDELRLVLSSIRNLL